MKTLGLIGGTSWVSTIDYYRYINQCINAQLGGLNFARCIIYSFNFGEIKQLTDAGETQKVRDLLTGAALHLKNSGAEALLLCANTLHVHADAIQPLVQLPLIHVASATAAAIVQHGLTTVGLLGTKITMEKEFYKEKLAQRGISTIVPDDEDRAFIHNSIFDELGKEIFLPATKARYLSIIDGLVSKGAQGIILGCTEIPLLLSQQDVVVPVFDTTRIHADAAVRFALAETQES